MFNCTEFKKIENMSAWAYRECPECGKSVHVNNYCGGWNGTICKGDPWGVEKSAEIHIVTLEKERDELLEDLERVNKAITHYVRKLPKNNPKAKILMNS